MTYTFNEAIKEIDNALDLIDYDEDMPNKIYEVFNKLREEYAPTVEMTKEEFETFDMAKFDEDSAEWLDDVEWGLVNYKYPDFFMAWLHPETIKVVDK